MRRSLPDNLNRGGDPKEERVERFGDNCHRRCPRSEDQFSGVEFTNVIEDLSWNGAQCDPHGSDSQPSSIRWYLIAVDSCETGYRSHKYEPGEIIT